MLDILLPAGVLVDSDDDSWELAEEWKQRRIYMFGDGQRQLRIRQSLSVIYRIVTSLTQWLDSRRWFFVVRTYNVVTSFYYIEG